MTEPTVRPADSALLTRKRPSYTHVNGCESGHWVDSILSDGEIVKLEDGSIWRIDSADTVDSSLWLETDDVTVCDGKLINTDDKIQRRSALAPVVVFEVWEQFGYRKTHPKMRRLVSY